MIVQPSYLGKPFYPAGFPLTPEQVSVEGETIQDIFLRRCDGNVTKSDEDTLKSFVLYYINAPVFTNECTEELRQKNLMKMTITDLIWECMEYGIDPF